MNRLKRQIKIEGLSLRVYTIDQADSVFRYNVLKQNDIVTNVAYFNSPEVGHVLTEMEGTDTGVGSLGLLC